MNQVRWFSRRRSRQCNVILLVIAGGLVLSQFLPSKWMSLPELDGARSLSWLYYFGVYHGSTPLPTVSHNGNATMPKSPSAIETLNVRYMGRDSFTVDVISIGSKKRIEYLTAQRQTWGAHLSVRNFWVATEDSDYDPDCYATLSSLSELEEAGGEESFYVHAKNCGRKPRLNGDGKESFLRAHFRHNYARPAYLRKNNLDGGWICAQLRPGQALSSVASLYNATVNKGWNESDVVRKAKRLESYSNLLPDFLLLLDDDTFVNLDLFQHYIESEVMDLSVPRAIAGCLVRSPIHMLNWTFPWGGFGLMLNRGSIARVILPIYCNNSNETEDYDGIAKEFVRLVCLRIEEDLIGEKALFASGMSIGDLWGAVSSSIDMCMHSDWISGYFVNFYYLSEQVALQQPAYVGVDHSRLHLYSDSEVYGNRKNLGNCRNDGIDKCSILSHLCHHMKPNDMVAKHVARLQNDTKSYHTTDRKNLSSTFLTQFRSWPHEQV